MRGNVISFRFTDAELEALEALQAPEDRSPSQTAARLVRDSLGVTLVSTPVDGVDIKQLIAEEVRKQLEELRGKLKAR